MSLPMLELVASAAVDDPTWRACLADVTPRTLLAFAYEGALAAALDASMTEPVHRAVRSLLGVAGAQTAVITQRDAAVVHAMFTRISPLVPAFLVQTGAATPPAQHVLARLVREHGFDDLYVVSSDDDVLAHRYECACTSVKIAPTPPAGTPATYWIREQDGLVSLCTRLAARLVELAPAQSVARP